MSETANARRPGRKAFAVQLRLWRVPLRAQEVADGVEPLKAFGLQFQSAWVLAHRRSARARASYSLLEMGKVQIARLQRS